MSLFEVVIIGGGTAGWMTAAALAKFLPQDTHRITLVESELIGTVGVGEATIPHIRYFNSMLEIDENDFVRSTGATYKLGIQFENWGKNGDSYIHPFGVHGRDFPLLDFHHCWLKLREENKVLPFDNYSLASMAAKHNKFMYPTEDSQSIFSSYTYAFHIDAGLYARYLRRYAEALGVIRREGKIADVLLDADNGNISSVVFDDGFTLQGNFFIDCSGFVGLLIEGTLKAGYDNWSHWLPCDSAVAVPSEKVLPLRPYTRSIACEAGWRWQIPLQHRTGNGYVYCSKYISDDDAKDQLLQNLDTPALADVRQLKFTAGRRYESWKKNCVAIGLSGGFLEPLESTSIYLIQVAIMKLLELFPHSEENPLRRLYFNKFMKTEYELIRDFLILHYRLNSKSDSAFWNYCATMEIPSSLERKMALFEDTAHVEHYSLGLFMRPSWLAVYLGQGFIPKEYDLRTRHVKNLDFRLTDFDNLIKNSVAAMPDAQAFLAKIHGDEVGQCPAATLSLYGRN
ncbi:tryptophan halogenase family protein [Cellvibrio mixtus]|uniref:tryptophan halogenase family protein n=1 Tax=Cellvibrio mixtus TaxID=39650 RepID=UPI0005865DAA|nr:tryptophan halogenase family protein [Cellvibrio mixtus]